MSQFQRLTTMDGVPAVNNFATKFPVELTNDGLSFAPPSDTKAVGELVLPPRLAQLLLDLRVLKGIPLAYLVPDPALLPPESIRFFHIDPTWVDRVIDGVFSAVSLGTVESLYNVNMLAACRTWLDDQLGWNPAKPMCGMLVRSDMVRRWPNMQVDAFSSGTSNDESKADIDVLRVEPLSSTILIAIFASAPAMVHLHEPNVGVRFGVEEAGGVWKLDGLADNVKPRSPSSRVLNLSSLGANLQPQRVANLLLQKPYTQVFKADASLEPRGSVDASAYKQPNGKFGFAVRGGKSFFDLSAKPLPKINVNG